MIAAYHVQHHHSGTASTWKKLREDTYGCSKDEVEIIVSACAMCKDKAKPQSRPSKYIWASAEGADASEELVAVSCQCRGPHCSEACTCAQNRVGCSAAYHKTSSSTLDCGRRKAINFSVPSTVAKKDYRRPVRKQPRATSRLRKNIHRRRRGDSGFRRPPELSPELMRTELQQREREDSEDGLQRLEEEDSVQHPTASEDELSEVRSGAQEDPSQARKLGESRVQWYQRVRDQDAPNDSSLYTQITAFVQGGIRLVSQSRVRTVYDRHLYPCRQRPLPPVVWTLEEDRVLPDEDGAQAPGWLRRIHDLARGADSDLFARAARWIERGVLELGSRAAFIAFCERLGTAFEECRDQNERMRLAACFSDFTERKGSIHRSSEVLSDLGLERPISVQIVHDADYHTAH